MNRKYFRFIFSFMLFAIVSSVASAIETQSHSNPPSAYTQTNLDDSALAVGDNAISNGVIINVTSGTLTCSATFVAQVELQLIGQGFTGTPNYQSDALTDASCGQTNPYPPIVISDLAPGNYKWQVRVDSSTADPSNWLRFNSGNIAFSYYPFYTIAPADGTEFVNPTGTIDFQFEYVPDAIDHVLYFTRPDATTFNSTLFKSSEYCVDGVCTYPMPVSSFLQAGTFSWYADECCGTGPVQFSNVSTINVTLVPPAITQQPASGNIATGNTADLSVTATGDGTLAYQWYQGASGTTTTPVGTNSSSFTTPTLTATTSYWVRVSSEFGSADSNTATLTVGDAPAITQQPTGGNITTGNTFDLSVVASGDGTLAYQWYEGTSGDTSVPVGENTSTYTTPTLTESTAYWVRVSSEFGSVDTDTATINIGNPPVITQQPTGGNIATGNTFDLSVVASGDGTLAYQWYQGTSGITDNPVGTDSSTYTTPALNASTAYWVRVSSEFGSVKSETASVVVGGAPVITTQPQSVEIDYDASTMLSVVASGDGTLAYQWYEGLSGATNNPIDGATSANFTTPNLKSDVNYWVRISSEFGSVDSDTATVSITSTLVTEGFEDKAAFKATWTTSNNLSKDKIKCNKDKDGDGITDKFFSYEGECAWMFKGSAFEKTKIKWAQIFTPELRAVNGLGAGDTVNLSLYADGRSSAVKLVVKIIALYTDGFKDKAKLIVSETNGYELIQNALDITKDVDRVKLIFVHKSKASKVFLDEIAMSVSETPVLATDTAQDTVTDTLPLPDAPEGFRN